MTTRQAREAPPRRRGGPQPVGLEWPNKGQSLVTDEFGAPQWVDEHDYRVAEVRLLHEAASCGEPGRNVLIRGDAAHALRSLSTLDNYREQYAEKVKLCYIDPPFNTGKAFRHYSDDLRSAVWLAMLRDRLVQIRELLAPDGSVWVHLDDAEQHRARCVLDEVFGADAFVATIIWQKRTTRDNRKAFSQMHDYIHVYAPAGPVAWKKSRNALADDGAFANPDNDPRGPWRSAPMSAQDGHATAAQFYSIRSPGGTVHNPPAGRCWTYTQARLAELIEDGRVYWPRQGHGKPRLKQFASESRGLAPFTIWTADEVGQNSDAKKALLANFPDQQVFDTPKPERLLERIIGITTSPGDLVLDCFLGSGTTAVVAQRLGRSWVAVERHAETVATFAMPRIEAALQGHTASGSAGFKVLDVGPSMFEHCDDAIHLAAWATGGALARATAAQLGYPYAEDGPFAGQRGNRRLAVLDGHADASVVAVLLDHLARGQKLDLAATSTERSAEAALRDAATGHRLHKIPEALIRSFAWRTDLGDLLSRQPGVQGAVKRRLTARGVAAS